MMYAYIRGNRSAKTGFFNRPFPSHQTRGRLNMFKEEYGDLKINNTPEMIALSEACARRMGMEPYYLYRQKNMAGNFENVGYSLPGKACRFTIFLIMEELATIVACGAGTTTKVVFPSENRRERCENVKK